MAQPQNLSPTKRTFEDDYSNNLNQQLAQEQQQQDMFDHGVSRRSRAKNFKNPPQPHLCIKEKTTDGQELFINVMSWTRIVDPNDANSPIPLYGGMRVQPSSPRSQCTSLIYAVMASPEVLKKVGRKQQTPELLNLVDLMCEFVEAMNPGLHLSRKPEVLKDRDLSGELKDVWNAVQSMREKQKFEGGHNMTSDNLVVYTEFGPPPPALDQQQQPAAPNYEQSILQLKQQQQQEQMDIQSAINTKNNTNLSDSTKVDDKTGVVDDLSKDVVKLKLEAGGDEADSNKLIENNVLKANGGDKETGVKTTPTHTAPPSQPTSVTQTPLPTNNSNNSNNNSSTTTNSSNHNKKEKEKDSNVTSSHPFQFMFRSSKSSHHHNNDDDASKKEKKEMLNNSSVSDKTDKEKEQDKDEPKKKGLSFFRRNKSSTPPAPTTPPQPVAAKPDVGHDKAIVEQFDDNNSSNNKKIEIEAATIFAK